MSDRDDLITRATERSEASPVDESWGYRLKLDEGEAFVGRWRGETVDEQNDGRRIYLYWDADGQRCWSRHYAALGREIDQAQPLVGCTIAVVRGPDYTSEKGTGHSYGVVTEPNDEPLPDYDDDDDSGAAKDIDW